jgi:hypothetical protein
MQTSNKERYKAAEKVNIKVKTQQLLQLLCKSQAYKSKNRDFFDNLE